MLTDWQIGQKTEINPDGVETTVVMAFTSVDGKFDAYSMSPGAARAMADDLSDTAEGIEPAPPERRRFPWSVWFIGYGTAAVLVRAFEGEWWIAAADSLFAIGGLWYWMRSADR